MRVSVLSLVFVRIISLLNRTCSRVGLSDCGSFDGLIYRVG